MGQNSQVPLFQGGMTVSSNWQKPLPNWPICSFLDLLAIMKSNWNPALWTPTSYWQLIIMDSCPCP